jgi:hypothetical protein
VAGGLTSTALLNVAIQSFKEEIEEAQKEDQRRLE